MIYCLIISLFIFAGLAIAEDCVPRTCDQSFPNDVSCGFVDDGCGSKLDCGICPSGYGCLSNNLCSALPSSGAYCYYVNKNTGMYFTTFSGNENLFDEVHYRVSGGSPEVVYSYCDDAALIKNRCGSPSNRFKGGILSRFAGPYAVSAPSGQTCFDTGFVNTNEITFLPASFSGSLPTGTKFAFNQNVNGHIQIDNNEVILDCRNHKLISDGLNGTINLFGSGTVVENCFIDADATTGIDVSWTSERSNVIKNHITILEEWGVGIHYVGSSGNIKLNTITEGVEVFAKGIEIEGSNNLITGNKICGSFNPLTVSCFSSDIIFGSFNQFSDPIFSCTNGWPQLGFNYKTC